MGTRSLCWRGDDAMAIETDQLQVVVTRHGGQIASLQPQDGPEMLWQPPWPGQRPQHADGRWGPAAEAPLLANICGWNCCLDRFGLRDNDQGRPLHGEAGVLPWRLHAQGSQGLRLDCDLPLAGLRLQRLLRIEGASLVVDTQVESQRHQEQEIEWCEHISLGPDILDGADIQADLATAMLHPDPGAHARSRFAAHAPGSEIPVSKALAMPAADAPPAGDIVAGPLCQGGWRVCNAAQGWQLQCDFDHHDFPWLCLWTEHRARTTPPWNGITRVRGMECSTKPFPEGIPPADRRLSLFDRPTVCSIPALGQLNRRIVLSVARLDS